MKKKYKIPKEWGGSKLAYIGKVILGKSEYKGKYIGHSWITDPSHIDMKKNHGQLNVGMLIEQLSNFPDDTPVRVIQEKDNGDLNYWVTSIEYHNGSGYDLSDEVSIIGEE
tara:strand:+ start:258 stop:590 length:333 start_codon:yes stop_codon:yes gene_type:complete